MIGLDNDKIKQYTTDRETLYQYIKNLRYGIFEGLNNYYMVYIDKITVAPQKILDRYFFAEKSDGELKEKRLRKVKSMIEIEYSSDKGEHWISLDKFIKKEFS